MEIYFDLDGTLLDVSQRNYLVYKNITEKLHGLPLFFDEYWGLKRNKIPFSEILKQSNIKNSERFFNQWFKEIEAYRYLKKDKLYPWTKDVLTLLSKRNSLYLMTLRRRPFNLKRQLKELEITDYFDKLWISNENLSDKSSLLCAAVKDKTAILIGDTEVDIVAAKKAGIKSIAVSSGIRTGDFLMKENPNFLIKDIRELSELLKIL